MSAPVDLSRRIADLSPAKLRLLMKRLGADGDGPPEEPIEPRPPGDRVPLSFSQRRLWFLDRLEPGRTAYSLPSALRLTGALDRAALAGAVAALSARHEVLRATFELADGDGGGDAAGAEADEPVQLFHPPGAHPASAARLPLADLAALPPGRRDAEAERLAAAEARRPFDLARGPLFRNLLARLDGRRHLLVQNLHHVVSDGWSRGLLVRDLVALYGALAAGRAPELPPLPVQYGDFCVWQRRRLTAEALAGSAELWRRTLDGAPAETTFPGDRPRPAAPTGAGAAVERPLPAERIEALEALARGRGATLFMALTAALATLLHRATGYDDLVIGTPIANRRRRELEDVAGFFVNNLVLRLDLAGGPTFAELLGRVRETALAAYAHQDLPFERVVEAAAPGRGGGRPPVFQGMVMLENLPPSRLELAGIAFEALPAESGSAKYDWIFAVERRGGGWRLRIEYSAELYDAARVERWADLYLRLLEEAAAEPERPVAELPRLTEAERAALEAGRRPAGAERERLRPREAAAAAAAEYVAPRGPREARLVALWAELLETDPARIGVRHDFFHLGGHSLLATRMLARLRRETGFELPVGAFFEAPTVAGLAESLEVMEWAAATAARAADREAAGGGTELEAQIEAQIEEGAL